MTPPHVCPGCDRAWIPLPGEPPNPRCPMCRFGRKALSSTHDGKLSPAPCDRCGYNGPGYFQPATHPCAEPEPKVAPSQELEA